MTRDESKRNYSISLSNEYDYNKFIDKIYDDFEKELKQAWIDGSNANYEALKKAGKLK